MESMCTTVVAHRPAVVFISSIRPRGAIQSERSRPIRVQEGAPNRFAGIGLLIFVIGLGLTVTPALQGCSPILIDASADRHFNGSWHGRSVHDGAIHRGDAALGGSRHCDARGDRRN